ncbi:MAG: hypothetical protein IK056_04620 [Clostridia bacterium]|nr:hypothetical protein [Clostridia bacterium]
MKKTLAFALALLMALAVLPGVLADVEPAHTHSWRQISRVEPTCTQSGRAVYSCTCGERNIVAIPALGHRYSQKVYVSYADCTHYGVFYWVCDRCGAHSGNGNDRPLGHEWGEWRIIKRATPEEDGIRQRVCERCGEKEETSFAYDPNDPGYTPHENGESAKDQLDLLRHDPKDTADDGSGFCITREPESGKVQPGEKLTLTVEVEGGTEPYTYEWHRWSPTTEASWYDTLSDFVKKQLEDRTVGGDSPEYEAGVNTRGFDYEYYCVIRDYEQRELTSLSARVEASLYIKEQPRNASLWEQSPVTLACEPAGGSGEYTYAWYNADGTPAEYDTGEAELTVYGAGEYYCLVSDGEDTRVSRTAAVYDAPPLSLEADIRTAEGWTRVAAEVLIQGGVPPYKAEWSVDGMYRGETDVRPTDMTDVYESRYLVFDEGLVISDFGTYTVTVTDSVDNTAAASVKIQLEIDEQPQSGMLPADGSGHVLSVKMSETAFDYGYTYTLYKNGEEFATENNVTVYEPGEYYFHIEDAIGRWADSDIAAVRDYAFYIDRVDVSGDITAPGDSVDLRIAVSDGAEEPVSYRVWLVTSEKDGLITGERLFAESDTNVISTDIPGLYRIWATDGNKKSDSVRVRVNYTSDKPLIIRQPESVTLEYREDGQYGAEMKLTCIAVSKDGNDGALKYDWQVYSEVGLFGGPGGWIPCGTGSTVEVPFMGHYRCRVTDTGTGKHVYSNEATVSIKLEVSLQLGEDVGEMQGGVQTGERYLYYEIKGGIAPYHVQVYYRGIVEQNGEYGTEYAEALARDFMDETGRSSRQDSRYGNMTRLYVDHDYTYMYCFDGQWYTGHDKYDYKIVVTDESGQEASADTYE